MRTNPDITPDILNAIWGAQQQEQTALRELSTGKRVNTPSDDPAASAALLQNQTQTSQVDQYLHNTDSVRNQLQTADSALSSVVTALTQAITLGVQGGNGTLGPTDFQAIAQQVQGIRDGIVQLANTSYRGVFVFGGTANTTPPYVLDSTQASGVLYNGNGNTNSVPIAAGHSLQANLPGNQLFQNVSGDVFASLQQLITALQSGNTTNIATATTQVRTAFDSLKTQRVFYGNAVNQLDANQTFLQQETVNLKSEENSLVGVDIAKASTDLSKAQTAYNATLAAAARILPTSLLDYLK
jgi:flagellar hook-associated protein 3 FlgL